MYLNSSHHRSNRRYRKEKKPWKAEDYRNAFLRVFAIAFGFSIARFTGWIEAQIENSTVRGNVSIPQLLLCILMVFFFFFVMYIVDNAVNENNLKDRANG